MHQRLRPTLATALTCLAVAVLLPVATVAVPVPALLVCAVLGSVVGALTGVWTWLTTGDPARGRAVGFTVAGVATIAWMALAGLIAVLGPATVPALTVLYALTGLGWFVRGSRSRPPRPRAPVSGMI